MFILDFAEVVAYPSFAVGATSGVWRLDAALTLRVICHQELEI